MLEQIGTLSSGERVQLNRNSTHTKSLIRACAQALALTDSMGRHNIIRPIEFDRVVGQSIVVETNDDDLIFYARRLYMSGYSRHVALRQPEDTKFITFFLSRRGPDVYLCRALYFGQKAPPEVWDHRNLPYQKARDDALNFWSTHAFVEGGVPIEPDPNYILWKCPWE